MRERYSYEIATSTSDGRWKSAVVSDDTFSRDPESIARSLLEQWIIDHQGRLPGGRVFVYSGVGRPDADQIVATVRVQVFRGDLHHRDAEPAAVAYLGHAARDYPRPRTVDQRPDTASTSNRLNRVRSRLRLPQARPGDQEADDHPPERVVVVGRRQHAGRPGPAADSAA